mmetsp:Transcript_33291/g.102811  ORF Transcript_33291/g.102811 Transcript_33291/m.102811 type:complete len:250 (-) Transcript_33291:58-807(-)|eukprot:CAMPEP_0174851574 /NCGR_PEP_ID=MMETSP1114-20130205/23261_1 /TAXON_ID=312471 /ORGANISM="Neobodo designis, Strain CCAP 1951/1" /LENGTH=249 /DNA_ID=CAMNT_0016086119 /DNA_START=38 /DNA_END=787 /DNA_ORIENTATION=+
MLRRALGRPSSVLLAEFMPLAMPALSPSMTEGTLSKWLKKPGDAVQSGDTIAMVGTDKAEVAFDHTGDDGFFGKALVEEGAQVKVGRVIAVLVEEEAEVAEAKDYTAPEADEPSAPQAKEPEPAKTVEPEAPKTPVKEGPSADLRAKLQRSGPAALVIGSSMSDESLNKIKPTGRNGRYTKADLTGATPSVPTGTPAKSATSASPQSKATAASAPRRSPWSVPTKPAAVVDSTVSDSRVIRQLIARSTW